MKRISSGRILPLVRCLALCAAVTLLSGCEGDRAVTLSDLTSGDETPCEEAGDITGGSGAGVTAVPEEDATGDSTAHNTGGTMDDACVYVYVCGSVVTPGVYELEQGSRVCDALEAAGGFSEGADENRINLAAGVRDGEMIFFPMVGEEIPDATAGCAYGMEGSEEGGLININTADVTLLCTLPGIGESKAKAIIRYREEHGAFRDITEIRNVSGIGENLYRDIADLICI